MDTLVLALTTTINTAATQKTTASRQKVGVGSVFTLHDAVRFGGTGTIDAFRLVADVVGVGIVIYKRVWGRGRVGVGTSPQHNSRRWSWNEL